MKNLIIIFFLLLFTANVSSAQQKSDSTHTWHFRVSPYFWFIGFKGTIYRPPTPTLAPEIPPPEFDIDIGFKEVASSLKFAIMLSGEYRTKYIATIFNYSSLILEGDAVTPIDFIFQNNHVRLDYHAGDISVGYRFIRSGKWELDGFLGTKFIYFKIAGRTDLVGDITFEGERSNLWIDPIIGLRAIYSPIKKLDISAYGDVGFFHRNELSNQFIGIVTWHFTKFFITSVGYRYWATEVEAKDAIFNGHIKGWIIRVGFQF